MDRGFVGSRTWMWVRVCLLAGMLALAISSCSQPSAHSTVTPGPARADDAQQILRVPLADGATITTLDPALELSPGADEILELVWPTLVTLDSSQQPHPWA